MVINALETPKITTLHIDSLSIILTQNIPRKNLSVHLKKNMINKLEPIIAHH